MERQFSIKTIADLTEGSDGISYKGDVALMHPEKSGFFWKYMDNPIYINAFTYAITLSGTVGLNIDDVDYSLGHETFVQITPLHLCYFHDASEDYSGLILSVSKSFVDNIPAYTVQDHIVQGIQMHGTPVVNISADDIKRLLSCMEIIGSDIADRQHRFRLEKIRNSLVRFYLEIDNALKAEETQLQEPRYGRILRSFMGLLIENFRTEHLVPFYSDALNLSPQYLTSVIKAQTGKTVSGFIDEMLYCEARNLLSDSEMSIQQIADALNFSDQSAFTKFFKRQSGSTPNAYRRKTSGES